MPLLPRRWQAAFRQRIRHFLLLVLLGAGVLSGLTALAFHKALRAGEWLLLGVPRAQPEGALRLLLLVLIPTLVGAGLCALVPRLAPEAGGGLALVREAYARDPRRLSARALFGTFLLTPLSLGAGTPLGPEGPTVVLTSGLSAAFARGLGLPSRQVRGMIPVGAAAGIAAIFNTPITGVVFALEEVIGTASRGVLGGAIVAAVAAAVVQKQALGGQHLLPAAPATWRSAFELPGFALVGLLAGLLAGALPLLAMRVRRTLHARTKDSHALRGGVAGLAVGLLGLASPQMLGVGYPEISDWLAGRGDALQAGVACAAKFLGVAVALATPLIGGVFAPSLFLGASLGAFLGHAIHIVFPQATIDPGAYALVGMGAFFGGFLRTPLAAVLIVFELTGDYGLVAPLMLAVAISSLLARRLSPVTLVEHQLEERGVSTDAGSDPLATIRAGDAMSGRPVCVAGELSLAEAWRGVMATPHRSFPVVDSEGRLLGLIERETLQHEARAAESVAAWMRPAPVVATPREPLDDVSFRLGEAGETRCPVVLSRDDPRVIGMVTPADLLRARVKATTAEVATSFEPLGR